MINKKILIYLVILFFISCASSRVTRSRGYVPINQTIAVAPSGGVLVDAISIELFNAGYTVIDTNQFSNFMVRYNLTDVEISNQQNLRLLQKEGIDCILTVKSVAGYDGKPQSATVRINNTESWEIIAGVSWQNGWGGRTGSWSDRSMRKDIPGAAIQIVKELMKQRR